MDTSLHPGELSASTRKEALRDVTTLNEQSRVCFIFYLLIIFDNFICICIFFMVNSNILFLKCIF